jgi:hypothetical protein
MNSLDAIIEKHTKHMAQVVLNFHDRFPNAQLIANECTEEHVAEIIKRISVLCLEKDEINNSEEVDFDLSDDCWRATVRYSNLLTYLTMKYQNEILLGLKSPNSGTRLYIASAIYEAPFFEAIPHLKIAYGIESDELNKMVLIKAITASEYTQYAVLTWKQVFMKIGKILGLTHHSSGTPNGAP